MERKLFPVEPAYLLHVHRKVQDLTFETHDKHEERNWFAGGSSSDKIINDLGVGDKEEDKDLLSLDPKEWKARSSHPSTEYAMGMDELPEVDRMCFIHWLTRLCSKSPAAGTPPNASSLPVRELPSGYRPHRHCCRWCSHQ